jgi:methyltransferase (TIGR00027 family)
MTGKAVVRAQRQVLDAEPKILADPLAVELIERAGGEEIIGVSADQRPPGWFRAPFLQGAVALKTASRKLAARVRQYVLLGAGIDSFAYRQPQCAAAIRIIEVDQPESQKFKRERLAACGIAVPHNVEFCPIGFEQASLPDGLAASRPDRNEPGFFSWPVSLCM